MASVTVLYFGPLAERMGARRATVTLQPGETLAALYARLCPPGREGSLPVAFARNEHYAEGTEQPVDGDEVAFLPPVGGG